MEIKKIDLDQIENSKFEFRPQLFEEFIGQEDIKKILHTTIISAKTRQKPIGHLLFSGPSGYGKTSLAQIVANQAGTNIRIITGYALNKPSDLISILTNLQKGEILFIDEIHRLRKNIEEVLYIAMEDNAIDMVLPEGGHLRIDVEPFTLIGATTRLDQLTPPLKNRFVYKCHFMDYDESELKKIIVRYMNVHEIAHTEEVIEKISSKIESVPREIHNFVIKLRDYLVKKTKSDKNLKLNIEDLVEFFERAQIDNGGLTNIHKKYLEILSQSANAVGLKTIATKLGMSEESVEEDIEPLLFKLGKIDKTARGRILIK